MTEGLEAGAVERLQAVAVEVAMPTRPGLDDAIALAEDLVACGLGGSATLEVASLPRGAVRSDAEPHVRGMLKEFGLDVPSTEDEAARYRLLLWAFAYWNLPLASFEGRFYERLVTWDNQDELDRTLVRLLHERDLVSSSVERLAIEREMRTAVKALLPAD